MADGRLTPAPRLRSSLGERTGSYTGVPWSAGVSHPSNGLLFVPALPWTSGLSKPTDWRWALGICLTLSRVPLLAVALGLVANGNLGVALAAVFAAIVAADILDGIVFESARTVTVGEARIRHIADALGDRVVVHSLFLLAVFQNLIDPYAYLPVLVRELALALTVSIPYVRTGSVVAANVPSKCATVLVAVLFFAAVNGHPNEPIVLVSFVLLAAIGLKTYTKAL